MKSDAITDIKLNGRLLPLNCSALRERVEPFTWLSFYTVEEKHLLAQKRWVKVIIVAKDYTSLTLLIKDPFVKKKNDRIKCITFTWSD